MIFFSLVTHKIDSTQVSDNNLSKNLKFLPGCSKSTSVTAEHGQP